MPTHSTAPPDQLETRLAVLRRIVYCTRCRARAVFTPPQPDQPQEPPGFSCIICGAFTRLTVAPPYTPRSDSAIAPKVMRGRRRGQEQVWTWQAAETTPSGRIAAR